MANKKIQTVQLASGGHLGGLGYGPLGEHTREAWRAECLLNFLAGKEKFKVWQESWKNQISKKSRLISFAAEISYTDGSKIVVLGADQHLPYAIDFVGCTFEKELLCLEYNFQFPVLFCGSEFNKRVSFYAATFENEINTKNAKFYKKVSFANAQFKTSAHFNDVNFYDGANFIHATFRRAYFNNANFSEAADFDLSTFQSISVFLNAKFSGRVDFSQAILAGSDFSESLFCKRSTFTRATLTGTSFEKSIFKAPANFSYLNIAGSADFSDIEFKDDCIFSGVIVSKEIKFCRTAFEKQCRFDFDTELNTKKFHWHRGTLFRGVVNFENAVFQNVGHFERVRFQGEFPNFLGVDNSKTLLIFSDDSYFNKNDISEDAVKRLGQLKRLSDEQGQTDQALMFNAFELNAKAKLPDASKILKITTGAYELVSDYGRSFTRPIFWYGFLIWFSFLFAMGNPFGEFSVNDEAKKACKEINTKALVEVQAAFEYAVFRAGGVLDFTDTDKQNNVINCKLFDSPYEPPVLRAWGVFKGIASLALLFLAALGLRNKYRIK